MKSVSLHFSGSDELYHVTSDGQDIYACRSRREAVIFVEELKCIYEKYDRGVSQDLNKREPTLKELEELMDEFSAEIEKRRRSK